MTGTFVGWRGVLLALEFVTPKTIEPKGADT